MKAKNRVFAIFALIFNILILGATGYGLYLSFSSTPDPLSVLRYFTIDSNALLCVAALMMIPNNIIKIAKPEKPYVPFFKNLKFVAVVSTTITLVTAYAFLGPTGMFGTYVQATLGALDINIMLKSEVFFLHTFAPALGILSEIFDKDVKAKYKLVTYGFIPLAIYTVPYLVFAVVPGLKATYGGDWYGFLSFNLLSNEIANTAVLALIAVLGEFLIALLFGTIIWALTLIGANSKDNRERVTYSYVGSKDEPKKEETPIVDAIPIEDPKEENPVEEALEEQPEVVAPIESIEEQPVVVEEIQAKPVEEQQQALEETPVEEEPVDEQPAEKEEVEPEETPEETPVEQPAEVQPEESKTEEKPQEEKKVWPFQKKKEKKGFAKKSEESKKEEPKEEKGQKPAKKSSPAKKPAAKKATPAKKSSPAKKAEPKKETKETTNKKSTNKGGTKVAVAKKEAAPAKKPAAKKEEPAKFNGKARVYHISQHENGYKVKLAGGEKAIKTFKTQKEAIAYAKELVKTQGGTYLIHSLDGSIRKG
ncbi:MAG: DUF2188 domain-containing protein [Bacilli bacterium]|nr:DUF2188 domain-containing protein [Bacilli bacterium]